MKIEYLEVRKDFRDKFEELIPREIGELLDARKAFILGAAVREEEKCFAAGALGFEVDTERDEEGEWVSAIEILWLFVGEPDRHRGVGEGLLFRLFDFAEGVGAEDIFLSLPATEDGAVFAAYFEEFGFVFEPVYMDRNGNLAAVGDTLEITLGEKDKKLAKYWDDSFSTEAVALLRGRYEGFEEEEDV